MPKNPKIIALYFKLQKIHLELSEQPLPIKEGQIMDRNFNSIIKTLKSFLQEPGN